MLLNNKDMKFEDILPSLQFLAQRGTEINDIKLLDEILLLKDSLAKLQINEG
jgi:hypothetical protein